MSEIDSVRRRLHPGMKELHLSPRAHRRLAAEMWRMSPLAGPMRGRWRSRPDKTLHWEDPLAFEDVYGPAHIILVNGAQIVRSWRGWRGRTLV